MRKCVLFVALLLIVVTGLAQTEQETGKMPLSIEARISKLERANNSLKNTTNSIKEQLPGDNIVPLRIKTAPNIAWGLAGMGAGALAGVAFAIKQDNAVLPLALAIVGLVCDIVAFTPTTVTVYVPERYASQKTYGNTNAVIQPYTFSEQRAAKEKKDTKQQFDTYFDTGLYKGKAGDYESAIVNFSNAIKVKPFSDVAYYNRGYIYYQMGKFDKAESDFKEALKINPDNKLARKWLKKITEKK